MKKAVNCIGMILISFFAFLVLLKPNICINAAISGVLLCGNVIIPSIYPFTFCVLFMHNGGVSTILKPFNKPIQKIFGLNYHEFSIFLLSLIGGYPMGARLLSNNKNAHSMINYCINAGPAFIILAVGKGAFKSLTVGWILFLSHILPSAIIALLTRPKIKTRSYAKENTTVNIIDNFVTSAASAADTVIKICALVILFSCISGYIEHFSVHFPPLYYLSLLFEVTNAVFKCNNILTVSFLLGFSGFSIWAQVFSMLKKVKINYLKFVFFRILHGGLSTIITFIQLKLFKLNAFTLSNNISFNYKPFINGGAVAVSLIIMGIVLIISLENKKYAGNLIEDIV